MATDLERAQEYQQRRHFTKASILYLKALPVQPAFEGLVESLLARGRIAEAIATAEQALAKPALRSARLLTAAGRAYYEYGKLEDARDRLDAATRMSPNHGEGYMWLGVVQSDLGMYQQAIDNLRRAIDLMPASVEPGLLLFDLHIKRGEMDLARDRFEQLVSADPALSNLTARLSGMLTPFARDDAFVSRLDDIVYNRNSGFASYYWSQALIDNDHSAAAFRHLVITLESDATVLHDFALQLLQGILDHLDPTLTAARLEVALRKAHTTASLSALAARYAVADRLNEAAEALRDALVIGDEESSVLASEQLLRLESEKLKQVVTIAEQMLGTQNTAPWHCLGMQLMRIGMTKEAVECFERVSDPGASTLYQWGYALMQLEEMDAAAEKFVQSLEMLPDYADPAAIEWAITQAGPAASHHRTRVGRAALASLTQQKFADWAFSGAQLYLSDVDDPVYASDCSQAVSASTDADAHLAWARVLRDTQKPAAAERFYQRCAELNSDRAEPHYELAEMRRAQAEQFLDQDEGAFRTQINLAIQGYEAAIEADPEYTSSFEAWAATLDLLEQGTGVGKMLQQAFGSGPASAALQIDSANLTDLREASARRAARLLNAIERNCDADDYHVYVDSALRLINKHGLMESAEQLFDRILGLERNDAYALYVKAYLLRQRGDPQKAVESLNRSIELDPDYRPSRTLRAECYTELGKYDEADNDFKAALATIPDDDQAGKQDLLTSWGAMLREAGEYTKAEARLLEALRNGFDESDEESRNRRYWVHFNRALTFSEAWQHDRAIDEYRRAARVDEDHPYAHHNIASALETQGHFASARTHWQMAIDCYHKRLPKALRDRDADYCVYFGEALLQVDRGELVGPENLARAALAFSPEHARAHGALASILIEQKREAERTGSNSGTVAKLYADARAAYNRAVRLVKDRPNQNARTKVELGELHLLMLDGADAQAAFNAAIQQRPTAQAYNGLGEACMTGGDSAAAIRAFEAALRMSPVDMAAHAGLANAQRKAGKLPEAERTFRKLLDIAPGHLDGMIGLANVLVELGEREGTAADQAQQYFQEAINRLSTALKMPQEEQPAVVKSSMSAAKYLRGYARIKLHNIERNWKQRRALRMSARHDFDDCRDTEVADAARRAALQLRESSRAGAVEGALQVIVPYTVVVIALLLIGLDHFFLFKGVPARSERLALTPASLVELRSESSAVPPAVVTALTRIQDVPFENMQALVERSRNDAGRNWKPDYEQHIRHAARSYYVKSWTNLGIASYISLMFTSLALLIAAAFLPRLTSLKLPGIEFQKEKSDVTETTRSISISRSGI